MYMCQLPFEYFWILFIVIFEIEIKNQSQV